MGKSKRRRSFHSSSSDDYEWEVAKPCSEVTITVYHFQNKISEVEDNDGLSVVLRHALPKKPNLENCTESLQASRVPYYTSRTKSSQDELQDKSLDTAQNCSSDDGPRISTSGSVCTTRIIKEIEERHVTTDDLNAAAAQLMKAELSNNKEKVIKVKAKLEKLREARRRNVKVRLTRTLPISCEQAKSPEDFSQLTTAPRDIEGCPLGKKRDTLKFHDQGRHQTDYLHSDDCGRAMREMIRQEKLENKHSCDRQFAMLFARNGVDDDFDDAFVSRKAKIYGQLENRLKNDAITDYKRREYAESNCLACLDRKQLYLVISVEQRMFLSIPEHSSLTQGHCVLAPLEHIGAMTRVDETTKDEARAFKYNLCRIAELWKGKGASYVFMETASYPNSFKHHVQIECVPVDSETMDEIPSYFKKALLDLGSEWDQNNRIVSLSQQGTGARDIIPQNFGYFAVEFGVDRGGYAKVIEDWSAFPLHFGLEVLAGVLGKSTDKWRKPKRDSVEELRRKAIDFEEKWTTLSSTREHDAKTQPHVSGITFESKLKPEGPELPHWMSPYAKKP